MNLVYSDKARHLIEKYIKRFKCIDDYISENRLSDECGGLG